MLESGLVQLLATDPDVSALLGGRIYPVKGPTDSPVYPFCCYRNIPSGSHTSTLDGRESGSKTIQFDVFSDEPSGYGSGKSVLLALRNVLVGYVGTLPDGTRILDTERGAEEDNFAEDQRAYHSFVEYEFEYIEV